MFCDGIGPSLVVKLCWKYWKYIFICPIFSKLNIYMFVTIMFFICPYFQGIPETLSPELYAHLLPRVPKPSSHRDTPVATPHNWLSQLIDNIYHTEVRSRLEESELGVFRAVSAPFEGAGTESQSILSDGWGESNFDFLDSASVDNGGKFAFNTTTSRVALLTEDSDVDREYLAQQDTLSDFGGPLWSTVHSILICLQTRYREVAHSPTISSRLQVSKFCQRYGHSYYIILSHKLFVDVCSLSAVFPF